MRHLFACMGDLTDVGGGCAATGAGIVGVTEEVIGSYIKKIGEQLQYIKIRLSFPLFIITNLPPGQI